MILFEIYLVVAVLIALRMCVYAGHVGDEDMVAAAVVTAAMWPLLAAAALVVAPFVLAFKVGSLIP